MASGTPDRGISRGIVLGILFIAGVVLAGLWFVRPWLHGIVYGIYTTPVIWLSVPIVVVLLWLSYRRTGNTWMNSNGVYVGGVAVFVIIFVLPAASGLFAANTLGHETMQASEDSDTLRETIASKPRIITRGVADRYASNTLPFSQYQVTDGDITVYNGTPYWSYALAPDGLWNYLTKEQHGTVLVDMTQQNAAIKTTTGDMSKGMGTAFYNNYRWQLLKKGDYLVEYADPFMVLHEGKQYIAVPYTTPEFHWLPLPHTTPSWGGVMLIDSNGDVADLSPSEARQHPVLENQKLYPFDLARSKVAATKYRNGIINTFTSHKGQIEVAPLPGTSNDQPFFLLTKKGPTYVVAVEPYGNTQGLKEVWMIDARTGEYLRYVPDKSLFGPRKAADYVRQAAPKTDWNRFNPSAPLPVVINGQFYWEVRIVPEDNSGISYIAFVNAQTSEVREVKTTGAVERFLQEQKTVEDSPKSPSRSPSIIVQRVAPNGTVLETMQVYGNESIQIVQQNSTNATDATNTTNATNAM
jgi:hypothetical protein